MTIKYDVLSLLTSRIPFFLAQILSSGIRLTHYEFSSILENENENLHIVSQDY
jgi:hypothetical protein